MAFDLCLEVVAVTSPAFTFLPNPQPQFSSLSWLSTPWGRGGGEEEDQTCFDTRQAGCQPRRATESSALMPFGNGAGGTGMENTEGKWQLESWHRDKGISDLPDDECVECSLDRGVGQGSIAQVLSSSLMKVWAQIHIQKR